MLFRSDHDRDKFEEKKKIFSSAASFLNEKYGPHTVEVILKDTYYNMKEKFASHMYLVDIARESMEKLGISPVVVPIRGGTDGARLSYMGIPCPNLCAGSENCHGIYEYVSVQSMEKIVMLLIQMGKTFERYGGESKV